MRKLLCALLLLLGTSGFSQFNSGNLALFQADASASNTTASIVEINPTSAGQSAISTVTITGTGSNALRFSGSATSTGYLANSNDGTLLSFMGVNNTNTSANANSLNPRGVGTLNSTKTFDLATTYTASSGDQTRCATSLNNSAWYIADQGGLFTNGTSAPSPGGNFRAVKSFGSIVYIATASSIGTINATTGGTVTALPGLSAFTNLQDFCLVRSGSNGTTYDVLYTVTNSTGSSNTAGTISKFCLVSGSWAAKGTYTTSFAGFGVAAKQNGTGANLFISSGAGALTANSVIRCTDANGYNTTISITTANNINLYTAPSGKIIKGVAFTPVAPPPPTPAVSLSVSTNTASETAATVVTITATASAAVTSDQTVSLTVTGTDITAGDYSLSNATITIPNGSTIGTVTFTVVDDIDVENTETATLTISGPSSGISLGTTVTQDIVITDNDIAALPTVNLSVSTNSASEGAATIVTVTATSSVAVTGDQTVLLAVTGTGITATDYSLSNTTITIPNGNTTGTVTFTIVDDADSEGAETATLTISAPSAGITLGTNVAQNIAIADNDLPLMRITEYAYSAANGEFIEFTNVGTTPIDMAGWSFDDADRVAGAQPLSAFGIVAAGESVILTENNEATFRTAWGLCNGIKIIGGLTNNLGRNDEINLYSSGALIDRLTYGDQNFPGSIRTENKSGWVTAAGLGANIATQWNLSVVGDGESSHASAGGDIGSPGKSTRATVAYDPCTIVSGAPTIIMDVIATTNAIDAGASTSPNTPYGVSGVINDPLDPAKMAGIDFTIGDDLTPVASLTVTVSSSNTTVVPNANITLTGTGASRNLKIIPATVGYSNISVTVNDGSIKTVYVINYAASQTSSANAKWHTGIADASAAIPLDDNYMIVANDETNLLYVYERKQPGLPVKTYDFNQGDILSLPDANKEVDLEAGVKSIANPGRIYWLGSLSNSSNSPFDNKPNRNRLFATTVSGTGAAANFTDAGHYNNLKARLIIWGDANGYNFTASAASGNDPKSIDGFNVEGMVFGPDDLTAYIGFRAPLVPTANRTKAVIAPIQNFENWFNNGSPAANPTIGAPIELELGGRGIRDIVKLSNNMYVIVAGSYDVVLDPAVYRWTGNAADAPVLLTSFGVSGLNIEGVMQVNNGSGQIALDKLQFISDNGDHVYYADGIAAKDLSQNNFKKFSSDIILAIGGVLPITFEYFTAGRNDNTASLKWKMGSLDNLQTFEVSRSFNGRDFTSIGSVNALPGQAAYTFTDNNATAEKIYYRINAVEIGGRKYSSDIRTLNSTMVNYVTIYPNPVVQDKFTITVNKTGNKTIQVYTTNGALYKEWNFSGTYEDVFTATWAKGYYIIRIISSDTVVTEKIVVQ